MEDCFHHCVSLLNLGNSSLTLLFLHSAVFGNLKHIHVQTIYYQLESFCKIILGNILCVLWRDYLKKVLLKSLSTPRSRENIFFKTMKLEITSHSIRFTEIQMNSVIIFNSVCCCKSIFNPLTKKNMRDAIPRRIQISHILNTYIYKHRS